MNIHTLYTYLFKVYRKKRFDLFIKKMSPTSEETLLDIGGYPKNWINKTSLFREIKIINIDNRLQVANYEKNISYEVGDALSLPYSDQSIDIAYPNSVIEHVGTFQDQHRFAKESMRVGKKYWVQTPAFECFFEPHYLTPFIHWLPDNIRMSKVIRWITVWGLITKPSPEEIKKFAKETRLLSKKEMRVLYPNCEIITERMLLGLLPKSYIAIKL